MMSVVVIQSFDSLWSHFKCFIIPQIYNLNSESVKFTLTVNRLLQLLHSMVHCECAFTLKFWYSSGNSIRVSDAMSLSRTPYIRGGMEVKIKLKRMSTQELVMTAPEKPQKN